MIKNNFKNRVMFYLMVVGIIFSAPVIEFDNPAPPALGQQPAPPEALAPPPPPPS